MCYYLQETNNKNKKKKKNKQTNNRLFLARHRDYWGHGSTITGVISGHVQRALVYSRHGRSREIKGGSKH